MSIIQTLAADAGAVENFLVDEGKQLVAFAEKGIAPVEAAFSSLVNDAKAEGAQLLSAAQGPLASVLANVEDAFETEIANIVQSLAGGDQTASTLLTALGAEGVGYVADTLTSLVKPIFVKVLAALVTPAAPAAAA